MMLKEQVAVIYGAGGAIGGAVARAFAREGARVFLTDRHRARVEALAQVIAASGGRAEAAEVDALDQAAIEGHLRSVVEIAGQIDISFNAVGVPEAEVLGVPFERLDRERFERPFLACTTSYFLSACAAARYMLASRSGVIMTVSGIPARLGSPTNGGYGPAQAAKEQLTRDLSCEFARHGVRVVGLRSHGIPESGTMKEIFQLKAQPVGMTWDQFTGLLANTTHTRRGMTLEEVASVAAFAASHQASGLTGTTLNLTMGVLDD